MVNPNNCDTFCCCCIFWFCAGINLCLLDALLFSYCLRFIIYSYCFINYNLNFITYHIVVFQDNLFEDSKLSATANIYLTQIILVFLDSFGCHADPGRRGEGEWLKTT